METSDSEYFESADEEFDGDDNLIPSKHTVTSQGTSSKHSKAIPVVSKKPNENDNLKADTKKVNMNQPDKKLGKKISFSDVNDTVENVDSTSISQEFKAMHVESTLKSEETFSSLRPQELSQVEGSWGWDEDVIDTKNLKLAVSKKPTESDCLKLEESKKFESSQSQTSVQNGNTWSWKGDNKASEKSNLLNSKECVKEEIAWGWEDDFETKPTRSEEFNSLNFKASALDENAWSWGENDSKETKHTKSEKSTVKEENAWGWEEDDWEAINKSIENEKLPSEEPKWSGWGNWGVSSLLSTATIGLSTVTSTVTNHMTQVLESGIGVPDPEELARLHKSEIDKVDKCEPDNSNSASHSTFGLGSLVSGVNQITKLVESTSNKVISGGLDTLETIGKKTMEVLQEGDPGLKKKRAFLHIKSDKPILSQILREAKEKAETENKNLSEEHFSKKVNYESLFDDHQGLVHLEALEMLSRQCDIKLQTILETLYGKDLMEMQETLEQIKDLCELPPEDKERVITNEELEEGLNKAVNEMNITLTFNKLLQTWIESEQWLNEIKLEIVNELELHEQSINILAQLTAIAVEIFHKIGELLLVKSHRSTVDEADSLVELTVLLTSLIDKVEKILCDKLLEKIKPTKGEESTELMLNLYLECANSTTYIQNSFQLLLPILQVGVL